MTFNELWIFGNGVWLGFVLGFGVAFWATRRARRTGRMPNVRRAIGEDQR